jgi:3-hydroxybutyryl-CoA dehydratase
MSAVDWSAPFEELRTGQAMHTCGRTVTETDLVSFAALTGDWHPQHADATWAATSRFGERIAHGMLILSYAVGLMPFDPERVVALRRVTDVVFKRPLKIGETIRAEGRIAGLTPLDDRTGLVACAWAVRNQDKALICHARIDVLWRRGALPSETPSKRLDRSAGPPSATQQQALIYPSGVFPC